VRRVPKTTTTSPASARAAWALGVVTVWAKTGPPKHVTRATMLMVATKCLHFLSAPIGILPPEILMSRIDAAMLRQCCKNVIDQFSPLADWDHIVSALKILWSGRWESNPRHLAWEASVLPLNYARNLPFIARRSTRVQRSSPHNTALTMSSITPHWPDATSQRSIILPSGILLGGAS
jgi:hypothetical protein